MKFVKKQITIEAEQFFPEKLPWPAGVMEILKDSENDYYFIRTLEGPLNVNPSDWIITGIKGEKYPCRVDIFEATYDPA